jgi:hypothetical protein
MTDDIREQKLTERLKEAMDAMELAWQEYLAANYPTSLPNDAQFEELIVHLRMAFFAGGQSAMEIYYIIRDK